MLETRVQYKNIIIESSKRNFKKNPMSMYIYIYSQDSVYIESIALGNHFLPMLSKSNYQMPLILCQRYVNLDIYPLSLTLNTLLYIRTCVYMYV